MKRPKNFLLISLWSIIPVLFLINFHFILPYYLLFVMLLYLINYFRSTCLYISLCQHWPLFVLVVVFSHTFLLWENRRWEYDFRFQILDPLTSKGFFSVVIFLYREMLLNTHFLRHFGILRVFQKLINLNYFFLFFATPLSYHKSF